MPRHQKTIGSFEGWAEVMGGILQVAGVPGFLGNLQEMYEQADAEGSAGGVSWPVVGALRHREVGRRGSVRPCSPVQHAARTGR